MTYRILIIEDSAEVSEALSLCLQIRWPDVEIVVAGEGSQGAARLADERFDIVILDLNLPDLDGFEVLKRIRSFSRVPVIIVTVRGKEDDQAKGLEIGADDYIVKPFRPRDLVARVNAVLRRTQESVPQSHDPIIESGNVSLDLVMGEANVGGEKVRLSQTEGRLLFSLMQKPGQTITSQDLLLEVWGPDFTDPELLRTYVRRLRDKLNDNPPRIILTDRGEGYRFVAA